jgi:hypothetical protein
MQPLPLAGRETGIGVWLGLKVLLIDAAGAMVETPALSQG